MTAETFYNLYGKYLVNGASGNATIDDPDECALCLPRRRKTASETIFHQWPIDKSQIFPLQMSGSHQGTFCCAGLNYRERISAVFFVDNNIGFYHMKADNAAISYRFTGCYMAKFVYQNQTYVCHITSKGGNVYGDCRKMWNDFVNQYSKQLINLCVFKPTDLTDILYSRYKYLCDQLNIKSYTICGLITPDNRCYALLMNIYTGEVYGHEYIQSRSCFNGGRIL